MQRGSLQFLGLNPFAYIPYIPQTIEAVNEVQKHLPPPSMREAPSENASIDGPTHEWIISPERMARFFQLYSVRF